MLIPAAPGYDAWAWLIWGREAWDGALSTAEGPAWKPLPVAITMLLAPFGSAAPDLWLVVARTGAITAVVLAFVVARQLAGDLLGGGGRGVTEETGDRRPAAAGVAAAAAVLLTGGFVRHAAVGDAEPLLVALGLAAFHRALTGRHRQALAFAVLAALLRPEAWPFVAAYALWRWRADPRVRPVLVAAGVAVLAAWFVPEWLSSGELLRSTERARIPNPGQPATADIPALETLARTPAVLFLPAALAALLARGPVRLLALGGAAWILLVAAMSQAGFSGEERYVLPGAAVLAVAGASAIARLDRAALDLPPWRRRLGRAAVAPGRTASWPRAGHVAVTLGFAALFAVAALPRVADIADLRPRLAYQQRLADSLPHAIARAGGRQAILTCGTPAVGRYRGTLLAWHLDVPKHVIRADGHPGDVTFRSRLTEHASVSPPGPPPQAEPWEIAYSPGSSCFSDSTGAKRSPSRS